MLVLGLVILFVSNGIFVNSASAAEDVPMLLPFYSLVHAFNNSGIKQADVESQLIALDGIAERLSNGTGKSEFLESTEHPFLDLQTIQSVAMSREPLGKVEIEVDYTPKRPLYTEMDVYKSTDDVCLGFTTTPDTHTADVIVYSQNSTFPYYLEQINLMSNSANGEVKSLEVYSVFVHRGLNEHGGVNTTNGVIVAYSRWVYIIRSHPSVEANFTLVKCSAEAFYLHKEGDSPDDGGSVSFNITTRFIIFVIVLVNIRL